MRKKYAKVSTNADGVAEQVDVRPPPPQSTSRAIGATAEEINLALDVAAEADAADVGDEVLVSL